MSEQLPYEDSSVQSFVSLQDNPLEHTGKSSESMSSHSVVSQLDSDNKAEQITFQVSHICATHSSDALEADAASETDGSDSDLNDEDWNLLDSSAAEISKHDVFVRPHALKCTGQEELRHNIFKNIETCQQFESITVLDKYTKLDLSDIVSNHILEKVDGIINVDSDVVVLHALRQDSLTKECAIKIYSKSVALKHSKEGSCINKREKRKPMALFRNPARREMCNLLQMQQAGIACPSVLFWRKNILVTSFIGENGIQAPTLKNLKLEYDRYGQVYKQIVNAMKILYNEVHLVHTNLSESNILWHDKKCYITNASHMVSSKHRHAFCYLIKSFEGFASYFTGCRRISMRYVDDFLKEVTGSDCVDKLTPKMWSKIERITKRNRWNPPNYENMCIYQQ